MWIIVLLLCTTLFTAGTLHAQPVQKLPPVGDIDLSKAKIVIFNPNSKILSNAADMLHDEIEKRTRISLDVLSKMPGSNEAAIVIGTARQLRANAFKAPPGYATPSKVDGYALWTDKSRRSAATICVAGHDERGTLFGTGRLLRLLEMSRDKVLIDIDVKVATAPVTKLRGHQIGYRPKTNSYDGWTLEMWEQYYRDMIVFGTNAIELLPPITDDALDSPHFPKPPLNMMIKMSQLAKDYGLDVWIWFPAMADDYSDPKVMDAAIEEWGEVFRSLPKIDVVFVPGGDPGNSHPSVLFRFMEKQKKNLNKYHPRGQIWMSPQGFDWRRERKGWLKDFYNIMQNEQPKWLGGIVFGPQVSTSLAKLRKAIPPQYPIRRYPDITHSGGGQYEVDNWDDAYDETLGREPINPRPRFYAKIYRKLDQYAIGFITYSEGCNDDVNKIIWSCLGWDPEMKVEDILKEYSRYFIGLRYEDKFAKGLAWLERNWKGDLEDNDGVYETLKLFQEMEKDATPQDKLNWRFQQGLYRAYYDAYVKARLPYEKALEKEAKKVLKGAKGSLEAIDKAEAILDRPFSDAKALQWRLRVHDLAEALYQSIRMQLSVPKYKAIREGRGDTLDHLDAPLNDSRDMKKEFMYIRQKVSKQTAGNDQYRPGLAGTDFDDEDFTEPDDGINILHKLDQHWAASQGNDWRAAWFGFIEGPFTGDVEFSALAIDGVELKIADKVIIDGLEKQSNRSGVVNMVKGQKLPIVIKFVTYESKAHLRMFWQWQGVEKSIIPAEALSYKLSALDPEVRFEFEYKGVENAGNWDNYHTVKPDVPAGQIDVSDAKIIVLQDHTILNNAADMLVDEIGKRSRLDIPVVDEIDAHGVYFVLGTKGDIGKKGISLPDGLEIAQKKDAYAVWLDVSGKTKKVFLVGHDKRGALFAAGRLLRLLDMGRDWAYLNSDVRMATAPVYPLRGHQLGYRPKTHSYDGWDVAIWEQYYRDMIVFGMNAVELIPPVSDDKEDSPHFPKPKLEMMVLMSQMAADYGLDVWIWFTALDKRDGKRVDYSDEATIKESLAEWAEVFQSLSKIDDVFVPGGDPGNTHPSILLPFMARQKKLLNKYHPNARIWVSPQNFDRNGKNTTGWYKAFVDIMQNEQPKWLDGVVFGPTVPVSLPDLRKDMPKQYLIRRYPDITHTRSAPYAVQDWDKALNNTQGREAINPRPISYAQIFRATADQAIGFVSYSEGCNDDFNKILWNCLGWDPDMKVEEIVREFSKYFINHRWQEKFAKGLFALEQNWVGELKNNTGVDETLKLFQELEAEATPQDKLNWRFQQALYRAYYDAYVRQRQLYELGLEAEAFEVLKKAEEIGPSVAITKALAILERAQTQKPAADLRQRVIVLAEALFQSIRMQHSVEKYHSQRYANLDDIDESVTDSEKIQKNLGKILALGSEEQKLAAIKKIKPSRSTWRQTPGAVWPDWTVPFDEYQKKRSGLYKPFSPGAKLDAEAEAVFSKLPEAVKAAFKREVPSQAGDIEIDEGDEDGERTARRFMKLNIRWAM